YREIALDRAPDQAAVVLGEGFELREAELPGPSVSAGQPGQRLGDARIAGLQPGTLQPAEHLQGGDPPILVRVERVEQAAVDRVGTSRGIRPAGFGDRLGHRGFLLFSLRGALRADTWYRLSERMRRLQQRAERSGRCWVRPGSGAAPTGVRQPG